MVNRVAECLVEIVREREGEEILLEDAKRLISTPLYALRERERDMIWEAYERADLLKKGEQS